MTDRPGMTGTSSMAISPAAPGDGLATAALGALAVGSRLPAPGAGSPSLAQAVNTHGGREPLPYGHGHCLIARIEGTAAGMVYMTPPIRWTEDHPPAQRAGLVQSLVEIELLAVAEAYRGQGIAAALLAAAGETARSAGSHLAFAKVRVGAFALMCWYRKRGYTIAAQAEPVVFRTRSGFESCDDGSDGHQLAAKPLQPGVVLRRRSERGSSMLVAEHAR
ncbi:GNAT family N-acetyltransferase [Streptomyces sp. NPDC001027]|uniref:GNAT family N-acetyltransferase n=1 Tax=Streptomyces sp. NPDC001027 TaxID=3154771 RepID=UPI00332A403F